MNNGANVVLCGRATDTGYCGSEAAYDGLQCGDKENNRIIPPIPYTFNPKKYGKMNNRGMSKKYLSLK
ncbi:hypothetical protein JCM11672_24300 [Alkaliphilus crotonatoxidans]